MDVIRVWVFGVNARELQRVCSNPNPNPNPDPNQVALLSLYLRKPSYAEHFRSDSVWRQSMKSAAIGVGTLLNGGFINGLSQTAEGYRLAKVRVTIRVRVRVRVRVRAVGLTTSTSRGSGDATRSLAASPLLRSKVGRLGPRLGLGWLV